MSKKKCEANIEFEKYKILINARNFHYDNFSKWASYFYIAIGALLVAYYTIVSSEKDFKEKEILIFLILLLGYSFSCLWYWSTKGYYYWNINFITLVNNYEKNVLKWKKKDRIYFIFANKQEQNSYSSPIKGANISTSKIAILFAYIVTLTWAFLFFKKIIDFIPLKNDIVCNILVYVLSILLSPFSIYALSNSFARKKLFSKIDHFKDLEINHNPVN